MDITLRFHAIFFLYQNENITEAHIIKLYDKGERFEWQLNLLDASNNAITIDKKHPNRIEILSRMLYLNYITKIGSWEYDPETGSFHLIIEIPLEDISMTKKMFDYLCFVMMIGCQDGVKEIYELINANESVGTGLSETIDEISKKLEKGESSNSTFKDGI